MAEVPPFCDRACDSLEVTDLEGPISRQLFEYLRQMSEQGKKCALSGLLNRIPDAQYREQLVGVMASLDDTSEREKILEDCIAKIKRGRFSGRLEELRRQLSVAEKNGEDPKIQTLAKEYQTLLKQSRDSQKAE